MFVHYAEAHHKDTRLVKAAVKLPGKISTNSDIAYHPYSRVS